MKGVVVAEFSRRQYWSFPYLSDKFHILFCIFERDTGFFPFRNNHPVACYSGIDMCFVNNNYIFPQFSVLYYHYVFYIAKLNRIFKSEKAASTRDNLLFFIYNNVSSKTVDANNPSSAKNNWQKRQHYNHKRKVNYNIYTQS